MSEMDKVFGAALVGVVVEANLWGIITSQTYLYFQNYPEDSLILKALVAGLWALEGFQIALTCRMIYGYLVTNVYADPAALTVLSWEWPLYLALSSIAAFCVQLFFARRVYMMSRNAVIHWLVSIPICVLALIQLVFGFVVMMEAYRLKEFVHLTSATLRWEVDVWLGSSALCDILIAGSVAYFLNRSRTGLKNTNKVINKLIAYTIETGLLTSTAAVLSFSTFSALGMNFVHVFLSYNMGSLYVTSFLANLHARRSARKITQNVDSSGGHDLQNLRSGTVVQIKRIHLGDQEPGKTPETLFPEDMGESDPAVNIPATSTMAGRYM